MKKYTSTPLRILHKLCFEQLDIYVYLNIVSINSHVNCTGANWIPAYQPVITIYPYFFNGSSIFYTCVVLCFLAIFPFCLHGPLICDLICKYLYISQLGMVYNENSTAFQFVKYTGILSLPMCIHTGIHAFKLYILFMCVTS